MHIRNSTTNSARVNQQGGLSLINLIHPGLNSRFDIAVAFTANYYLSGRRHPVDSETFLMTVFVNLKIKPTQSFGGAYNDRIYMCVFIKINTHTYINIYVCTVF
jgi:hypothetical protein